MASTIVKLNPQDRQVAANLLRLQLLSYRSEANEIGASLPGQEDTVNDILNDTATVFGYQEDKELLGAIAYLRKGTTVKITRLFVHPQHQRQRIASRLYHQVISSEASAHRIIVETSAKSQAAVDFYRNKGFKPKPSRKSEHGTLLFERPTSLAWELDDDREHIKLLFVAALAVACLLLLWIKRKPDNVR